ncbi:MAG: hypothetical protein JNM70_02810, partial [Anaerolineae bacterium]|nr:hypothetical protein [Anaerolineae bacterium]
MTTHQRDKQPERTDRGRTPESRTDQAAAPLGSPDDLLYLQHTIGNQAVQRLLAGKNSSGSAIQREEAVGSPEVNDSSESTGGGDLVAQAQPDRTIQRDGPTDTATTTTAAPAPARDTSVEGALTSAALEEIRGQALARTLKLGMYATRGMQVVDRARTKLVAFSERYNSVYDVYAGVVGDARSEARNQQAWIDFFAGVAIGVGVGLLAEAIVVGAIGEAAAASLSLAQRALILAPSKLAPQVSRIS